MNGGIIGKAEKGTDSYLEAEIKEKVNLAYNEWKMDKESGGSLDLKEVVENELNKSYGEESVDVSKAGKGVQVKVTKSGKDYEYTLIPDGTTVNGQLAYLDIADGNIDLYENGYKQYTGNLQRLNKNGATECNGKYVITGTTTENVVRVCDTGNYDITIKNLNIDVSSKSKVCPFNANKAYKGKQTFVNLELNGNNYLKGNDAPGLGFARATPNINGETNGSTLIINGEGYLEARGQGWSSGIGSNYSAGDAAGAVSNIIINSGNIKAIGSTNGAGIGGALYKDTKNIIINGGNIEAIGNNMSAGIGANGAIVENIIINGGRITAIAGNHGVGIGGTKKDSGKLEINGGNIVATGGYYGFSGIGGMCNKVKITGGIINAKSASGNSQEGITCGEGGTIEITGGNILARGKNFNIATYEEGTSNLIAYTPNDGTNNLYETQIKLQGVEKDKQVTRLTTSDNINYGTKDMYTLEEGMLYLYLPLGTRTINVEVDGNTYSGIVETKETAEVVTLNKVN